MPALLLTLGLFLAWTAIGLATLVCVRADVRDLRVALSAPILGTAVAIVPMFVVSNAGAPMNVGALPVWIVLFVASLIAIAWRRPRLPLAVVPVVLLCLVEMLLLGRPMFHFGLDWLANVNPDMAYYVLSASELMRHGLQTPIDFHALDANRDLTSFAQLLNRRGLRAGTQVMLAALAGASGKPPVIFYMPMSIAVAMSSVCGVGSLAMQASRRWWAASVAALLFVVSPMAAYGVMQQLLPQNWGLGLAVVLFAWLMRPGLYKRGVANVSDLVVIGLLSAALFVVAYEVAASLVLAYLLYVVILALQRRVSIRSLGILWGVGLGAIAIVNNTFLPRAVKYIATYVLPFSTSGGFKNASSFGYAVVPSAIPGVVGLRSLFTIPTAPNIQTSMVISALLIAGLFAAAALTASWGAAAGITLLADIAVGVMLAKNGNDFGLFKLYMYIQPFAAATVAVLLSGIRSRLTVIVLAVVTVVVAHAQLGTLNEYVRASFNPVDLRNASASDQLPKFRRLFANAAQPVVTVTDNAALLWLQAADAGSRPLFVVSRNQFAADWTIRRLEIPLAHGKKRLAFSENTGASRALSSGSCSIFLTTGSQQALNRRSLPEGSPDFVMRRCGQPKNTLVFVSSSLGQPWSLPDRPRSVSLWQVQNDPFFAGRTFSGFGRFALFQILNPTPRVRVVLDFTSSPVHTRQGAAHLPPAAVIGAERVSFPIVGSGSARVVSPPVRPLIVDGRPYIVLDMGRPGRLPSIPRPGITGLWGESALLDPRVLTSFVRDVSLVSPGQYRRFDRPAAVQSIPSDLANRDLEYSGIYEDGWIGRTSYVRLAGGAPGRLVVEALVTSRHPGERLVVRVNGQLVAVRSARPGKLRLAVPVPAAAGPRTVSLHWSATSELSPSDVRQAAARLTYIGISS